MSGRGTGKIAAISDGCVLTLSLQIHQCEGCWKIPLSHLQEYVDQSLRLDTLRYEEQAGQEDVSRKDNIGSVLDNHVLSGMARSADAVVSSTVVLCHSSSLSQRI